MADVCAHGGLRRQCETCHMEEEVIGLTAERDRLRAALGLIAAIGRNSVGILGARQIARDALTHPKGDQTDDRRTDRYSGSDSGDATGRGCAHPDGALRGASGAVDGTPVREDVHAADNQVRLEATEKLTTFLDTAARFDAFVHGRESEARNIDGVEVRYDEASRTHSGRYVVRSAGKTSADAVNATKSAIRLIAQSPWCRPDHEANTTHNLLQAPRPETGVHAAIERAIGLVFSAGICDADSFRAEGHARKVLQAEMVLRMSQARAIFNETGAVTTGRICPQDGEVCWDACDEEFCAYEAKQQFNDVGGGCLPNTGAGAHAAVTPNQAAEAATESLGTKHPSPNPSAITEVIERLEARCTKRQGRIPSDKPCATSDMWPDCYCDNCRGADMLRTLQEQVTRLEDERKDIAEILPGLQEAAFGHSKPLTQIVAERARDEAEYNEGVAEDRLAFAEAEVRAAERELDEARAEVERLKPYMQHKSACALVPSIYGDQARKLLTLQGRSVICTCGLDAELTRLKGAQP